MPRQAGISARISGDAKPLKQALDTSLMDTQSWVNKIVGLNTSAQKSYNSLAFSGPTARGKSPIQMLADEDARAWARRMSDTQKHTQSWGRALSGGSGQAVLQTAQAVDDLQYGLRGVMNNIPGLIMSLGGGAGLAGILSLVAVGVATVGKKFWDWWTFKDKIKELNGWLEEMNGKLKEAANTRSKEALEGTAAGAEALANAVERANEALAEQQGRLARTAAASQEMAAAQAALDEARISGTPKEKAVAQQRVEVEQAKAQHRAVIDQMKAEREAHAARETALDDYAKKAEAEAEAAKARAASVGQFADPFIRETENAKADAAAVDAAKARAEAQRAAVESLKEQQRLADQIATSERVFALELQAIWARTNRRIADAEGAEAARAAEMKQQQDEATAAADEKRRKEAAAAEEEKRRILEERREERAREARVQGAQVSGEVGRGADTDRSRRINARARRDRRSFGVDDVIARRGSSLRGDLDAYIGPVGYRQQAAYTDRQAHQMRVNRANDASDPAAATLKSIDKRLADIKDNTDGLTKTKSEPLRRN